MKYILLILFGFLISSCAQLPPSPEDIQAKQFEPVTDRAVIYVVRPLVDGNVQAPLVIADGMISTHPGTYFRWVVAPGVQTIAGAGASTAVVTVHAEAGKIYFVEHTAVGNTRNGLQSMSLRRIDATRGRSMVRAATML